MNSNNDTLNSSQYKNLPNSGKYIQFSENNSDSCDIVIGFDFGTAFTKVVFQSPYHHNKMSFPIPFLINEDETYFLPTIIYYHKFNGKTQLQTFDGYKKFENLKLRFIDDPNLKIGKLENGVDITASSLVICYIANVLQKSREWFFKNKQSLYKDKKIFWHLNIGIPSSRFKDKYFVLYRNITLASWHLSTSNEDLSIENALKIFNSCLQQNLHNNTEIEIDVKPEVTAEVISYVRSEYRKNGLHLIIDIGANTLDIAGFQLFERDGIDNYSLLETDVRRLGSYRCHLARIKLMKSHVKEFYKKIVLEEIFTNPHTNLPGKIFHYLPSDINNLNENESEFYKKSKIAIAKVILKLKREKDPNSFEWEKGLPIFLGGGGQYVDLYKNVLVDIEQMFKYEINIKGFDIKQLEKPGNFDCPPNLDYCRMAVAYGLSFPNRDFGEIWPSSKARKIKKICKIRFNEENYIRKEDT